MINCQQTRLCKQRLNKIPPEPKLFIDEQIKLILVNPNLGVKKKGDLKDIYVHKFKINNQLYLLAYLYNTAANTIILVAFDTHENFYRDLKRS